MSCEKDNLQSKRKKNKINIVMHADKYMDKYYFYELIGGQFENSSLLFLIYLDEDKYNFIGTASFVIY